MATFAEVTDNECINEKYPSQKQCLPILHNKKVRGKMGRDRKSHTGFRFDGTIIDDLE